MPCRLHSLRNIFVQSQRCMSSVACRRVVVTGIGLVTCLGVGTEHVWKRILDGHTGIQKLEGEEYAKMPCKVAGLVPRGSHQGELDLDAHLTRSELRQMSLGTCFAIVAAQEALQQAGWAPETEEQRCYTGVAVGTGIAGVDDLCVTGHAFQEHGYSKVSPFLLLRILSNMPAGQISLRGGFKGPNHTVSTACATGTHAIGDAFRMVAHGDAEVMVCGGTEAPVSPLPMAAFSRIRALSTSFNDRPEEASRPFDADRDGFVMGEGAGIMVLEELEHARTRGAPILAEILGYGLSGDAHHITAPSHEGDGALRCMQAALRSACLKPSDVGYINAHATSTPLGDAAEATAVAALVGASEGGRTAKLSVSSTKGALGHLQGAAGSVEAALTVLACRDGVLPPTVNCHNPSPQLAAFDHVPLSSRPWHSPEKHKGGGVKSQRRVALNNSFGFGGTNASLCISSWEEEGS